MQGCHLAINLYKKGAVGYCVGTLDCIMKAPQSLWGFTHVTIGATEKIVGLNALLSSTVAVVVGGDFFYHSIGNKGYVVVIHHPGTEQLAMHRFGGRAVRARR